VGFAAHLRIGAFHSRFESVSWHSPPVQKLGVREFGYPMRTGRYRNHSRMCLQLINHATSFFAGPHLDVLGGQFSAPTNAASAANRTAMYSAGYRCVSRNV
jgi:hypothetical protein